MSPDELKDLAQSGETTRVQFKEVFTTETKIAQEMVAFANTRGGVILFGVKDKTGELCGLTYQQLQDFGMKIGNAANEQVKPAIYIDTEVVKCEGKRYLVCHIAEGVNKPYKTNNGEIWVKQGADKRRVTENSEILQLFQDSGSYHADEAAIQGTSKDDIEMSYIRDYFQKVYGTSVEEFILPLDRTLRSLQILNAKGEMTRAGMLFFGKNPQMYEHSFKIKAVAFVGNDIGGTEYIDSRDITGTVPAMFRDGMAFLKSMLHHRQEGQNFNSTGILEIPEIVLEELLQNALIHIDLLHYAAIRLLIFENRIEIINPGRLYGGLNVEDVLLGVSKQRNPLMAFFAENTMVFRGLGSGIVRALKEDANIDFINEERTNQFRVIIWRIKEKAVIEEQKRRLFSNETIQKDSETIQNTIQKDSETIQKTIQKDSVTIQKTLNERGITLTEMQKSILCYFAENPEATRVGYINSHNDASEGGVISNIGRLQQLNLLKRVGGRKKGHWEILV